MSVANNGHVVTKSIANNRGKVSRMSNVGSNTANTKSAYSQAHTSICL